MFRSSFSKQNQKSLILNHIAKIVFTEYSIIFNILILLADSFVLETILFLEKMQGRLLVLAIHY